MARPDHFPLVPADLGQMRRCQSSGSGDQGDPDGDRRRRIRHRPEDAPPRRSLPPVGHRGHGPSVLTETAPRGYRQRGTSGPNLCTEVFGPQAPKCLIDATGQGRGQACRQSCDTTIRAICWRQWLQCGLPDGGQRRRRLRLLRQGLRRLLGCQASPRVRGGSQSVGVVPGQSGRCASRQRTPSGPTTAAWETPAGRSRRSPGRMGTGSAPSRKVMLPRTQ